jgi:hypothetical protein
MDDLSTALSSLLQNPQTMEQLGAVAKQLGLQLPAQNSQEDPPPQSPQEAPDGLTPERLGALLETIRQGSVSDDTAQFLEALRPLLREEKQEKLDRALRALRLLRTAKLVSQTVEL